MTHLARCRSLLAGLALLAVALIAVALIAACSSGAEPGATPTPPPGAPAASATAAPATAPATIEATPTRESTPFGVPELSEPDPDRAFADLRVLAVDIGVRSAGTQEERDAAAFVAERLREAGYVVDIEEFDAQYNARDSQVAADGEGPPVRALALAGSRDGQATARLVHAGLGDREDFRDVDVAGAVALLDRGVIPFRDKARNAQDAGAVAVVVVNNEGGLFGGTLGARSGVTIPVIGVAGESGPALRALAGDGTAVRVTAESGERTVTSQNVVGRMGDAPCRAYLGAHYDSVPYGPGANDNASGTALLLELARTHRAEGLCFIAFGAEEIGLHGSRAFVESNDVSDVVFMLNFDMVARIGERAQDGPRFVPGDTALADQAAAVAARLGHGIARGGFPRGASSDHVSFEEAGVPAITVHSGGSEFIHQPGDTIDTVFREDLAILLEVSTALLRELLAAGGG